MKFIPRLIAPQLARAAKAFSAVIVTGPRRSGKTTLLRRQFPDAAYYLLEDPDIVSRLREDPRTFLDEVRTPAILDEIQNVPEVLNYIRTRIDRFPGKKGQWLLTGSQDAPLMRGVTESMAGRAAVFQLMPFSRQESPKVSLLRGGFPEALAKPSTSDIWFRSYVQTYLERDVRAVSSIRDLAAFRRFMSLVGARCGQILNRTDLAAPLGVSVPTISEWLGILETTSQILLIPPFYENFGKRLIKSPKLFFVDSGLACHLLGIESEAMLNRSPFLGPIFEGSVASEIVKLQLAAGKSKKLYFFRDQQGLEVDFFVPHGDRSLTVIEAKASRTLTPAMAGPFSRLREAMKNYRVSGFVVQRESGDAQSLSALGKGMKAVSVDGLPALIIPRR